MIYKIVAIRDRQIEVYSVPVFVVTLGTAVRSFGDEVKRVHTDERPNQLNLHPEDFDLFHMGDFDDGTGQFESIAIPALLARAIDYI